jgi:DNA replication and repair protein RecF
MHLESLYIQQFKNYESLQIQFAEGLNCFTGNNGAGKTNILDAIHYISFTKSYFNAIDQFQAFLGGHFFVIESVCAQQGIQETIRIVYQKGNGKILLVNGNELPKFSEHIGAIPLVMIAPGDISLIQEGSEERRKFIDQVISQCDKLYLNALIHYNKTLDQRNKLLKDFKLQGGFNRALLETYNEQLVQSGNYIFTKRASFIEQIIPLFLAHYQWISGPNEKVSMVYESDLSRATFEHLLDQTESADLDLMRTTRGVHRDDLTFLLGGNALKKFGSQGQQKSFLIALKLAQFDYLTQNKGKKPLLLLDDIFEKLDQTRLKKLFEQMADGKFGQVFLTDTQKERVLEMCKVNTLEAKFFDIDNGQILT